MALIDVSELLDDPDFCDPITLIHRSAVVNEYGENILTEKQSICTHGSVQPASAKVVMRLPEEMRVADIKSFWLKATIIADMQGNYSDILVFKGQRYQVQTVADWSNFGDGYTEGTCIREKLAR